MHLLLLSPMEAKIQGQARRLGVLNSPPLRKTHPVVVLQTFRTNQFLLDTSYSRLLPQAFSDFLAQLCSLCDDLTCDDCCDMSLGNSDHPSGRHYIRSPRVVVTDCARPFGPLVTPKATLSSLVGCHALQAAFKHTPFVRAPKLVYLQSPHVPCLIDLPSSSSVSTVVLSAQSRTRVTDSATTGAYRFLRIATRSLQRLVNRMPSFGGAHSDAVSRD